MSTLILEKTQDCSVEFVEETVTVNNPTQFLLRTNSSANGQIYFNGVLVAVLSTTNRTYVAEAVGDYTVQLIGTCTIARIYTSLISDPQGSGGGGGTGIVTACASDDGRLILVDTSVVPATLSEMDGTPIGGGVTAVNCSSGGGGGGPEVICASTDGRLILIDTSVVPATLSELDGSAIGDGATAVACAGDSGPLADQTHALSHGTDINVPAGAKSVTIVRLTGEVIVDGGFTLGDSPYPQSITYNASEVVGARALLPAIAMTGTGTFQWSAVLPVAEE